MAPNPAMRHSDAWLSPGGDFHCRPIWLGGSLSSVCFPPYLAIVAERWQPDLQIVSLRAPSSSKTLAAFSCIVLNIFTLWLVKGSQIIFDHICQISFLKALWHVIFILINQIYLQTKIWCSIAFDLKYCDIVFKRGFMQEAIRIQLPHLLGNYQGNICVFDLNRDSAFCKMCQNGSRIICSAARGLKQQATLLVESLSYFDHRVFNFHTLITESLIFILWSLSRNLFQFSRNASLIFARHDHPKVFLMMETAARSSSLNSFEDQWPTVGGRQIYFIIWTNKFSNLDKSILHNMDKYILKRLPEAPVWSHLEINDRMLDVGLRKKMHFLIIMQCPVFLRFRSPGI